jgi:hypothetical protein
MEYLISGALIAAVVLGVTEWLDRRNEAKAVGRRRAILDASTEQIGGFDAYVYPLSEVDPEEIERRIGVKR